MNKIEAIDTYAKVLSGNSDKKVRFEYAGLLEKHNLFAKALEEYRAILAETFSTADELKKYDVRFSLACLLLTADASSGEWLTEMETAVKEGYNNIDEVEKLQKNTKISTANREKIRNIVNNMQRAAEAKEAAEKALSGK